MISLLSLSDQAAMLAISITLAVGLVILETARVLLFPFRKPGAQAPKLTILVDGECAVCSALRSHVIHRLNDPASDRVAFVPAQRVLEAFSGEEKDDAEAQAVKINLESQNVNPEHLLDHLHAVEDGVKIHVGAYAILRMFDVCHQPYPLAAKLGRLLPQGPVDAIYGCFSRNRHKWFGTLPAANWRRTHLAPRLSKVDVEDQRRLCVAELCVGLFALVTYLSVCILPFSDRHKDGPVHLFARCVLFALTVSLIAYAASDGDFFERFVGPASGHSLAVLRVACALILLLFTADFVTTPLARTSEVPHYMFHPHGLAYFLDKYTFVHTMRFSATALHRLEVLTRLSLVCAMCGFVTNWSLVVASISWIIYGGILHAYNTWRGHSFICAWWGLIILAIRGGASDVWSVDAYLKKKTGKSSEDTQEKRDRNGWTRFAITCVLSANYAMAGGTKLCASGVLWADGTNLKAKLLGDVLGGQGWFNLGNVSFKIRHAPWVFWTFLGVCGLFGELAMGLVPFWRPSKMIFPFLMWQMHIGIFILQHILFADLLTFIPLWALAHCVCHAQDRDGPWGLFPPVFGASKRRAAMLAYEENTKELREKEDQEGLLQKRRTASSKKGARFCILLMAAFSWNWIFGYEAYPLNAFRMFTTYETETGYSRQVTEDTDGVRGRNWHYHELNPVLNRKRVLDAFRNCADRPGSHACRNFIAFAQPRALLMEGRPARLVFQTRTWDFDADLDKEFSCDAMETYTFYVAAGRVEHESHAHCDYIDWTTTGRFQQNLGTI